LDNPTYTSKLKNNRWAHPRIIKNIRRGKLILSNLAPLLWSQIACNGAPQALKMFEASMPWKTRP
jgi:hypothetical protein